MAKDVPLGMEFMNWQNVPSLTETIASGKSPLLKTLGILLADGEKPKTDYGIAPPAMGQGISPGGGIGIDPNKSNNFGLQASSFPQTTLQAPKLPNIGQQENDLNEDGQIYSFWGVPK